MTCETVKVSNTANADADGEYQYMPQERVSWELDKPVYKELQKDRYIFWTEGQGYGTQWVIGSYSMLSTGSYLQKSKLSWVYRWVHRWSCLYIKIIAAFSLIHSKQFPGNLQSLEPWEGDWVDGEIVGCKEGKTLKVYQWWFERVSKI